ncbi:MAG: hypothetical protein JXR95_06635 [Deltaproteobacteria bacterium]|nr:hypothetical protein [Deltaproteobacteria bacterium]
MNNIKKFTAYASTLAILAGCTSSVKTNTDTTEKKEKPVEYMKENAKETGKNEVLVFALKDGKTTGVPGKLNVEVKKITTGEFVITSGGKTIPGAMKSSITVAAFNGALASGKDLNGFEIIVSGDMDRAAFPSQAGIGAMIMAGMTGEKVKPESAIIGTVNPDGTIGPVDDLPGILGAAISAGKKEIGYCAGQSRAWSPSKNEFVDIEEFAKSSGVKVIKVSNIYDAFKVLTGSAIKLPAEITPDEMKLSRELSGQLSGMSSNWKKVYSGYIKKYSKLRNKADKKTKSWNDVATRYMKASDELAKKGEIAPSYDYAQRGGGFAYTSFWSRKFDKYSKSKSLKGMLKITDEFKTVSKAVIETKENFKKIKPENLGDLFALMSAYGQLASGSAYAYEGDGFLKLTQEKINFLLSKKLSPSMDGDRLGKILEKTLLKFSMADLKTNKAKDFSKFVGLKGGKFVIQLDKFKKINFLLKQVSYNHFEYAKDLLVSQVAKKSGKTVEETEKELASSSNNYIQASTILNLMKNEKSTGDFDQLLSEIASYSSVYFNTSMLLLKNHILDIRKSESGKVESVKRREYLSKLIEAAEKNVRVQAALAKKYSGTIPASAIFNYNIAMNMKDREFGLQIKALEMFWKASIDCQLSILIAN